MTEALYMNDCYLKEFDAKVIEVEGDSVILDRTAFYPTGGGVLCDTGWIVKGDSRFGVTEVSKGERQTTHEVRQAPRILHKAPGLSVWTHEMRQSPLAAGDAVRGIIDWSRRYMLMRHHTSAHLLSSIFYNELHVLVTGNQIGVEQSRIDYSMETMDMDAIKRIFDKANEWIAKDSPVKIYTRSREEALKIPGVVKLASALPPNIETLRIVEIEGADIQADGGCHVRSLSEIGRIEFLRAENKGKNNRRVYYTVKP